MRAWGRQEVKRQFQIGRKLFFVYHSTQGEINQHRVVNKVTSHDIAMSGSGLFGILTHLDLPTKANAILYIPTEDGFIYRTRFGTSLTYRWVQEDTE
jgi:hypothetical protein